MEDGEGGEAAAGSSSRSDFHPVTPDDRYFVVRGRLWRRSDPRLDEADRQRFVLALMDARRAVGRARRAGAAEDLGAARAAVDRAKRSLGERGPVWWDDGAPDFNRRMARNTPYAEWFTTLAAQAHSPASAANESPDGAVGRGRIQEDPGE